MDFSLFQTLNTRANELLIHTFLSVYTSSLRVHGYGRLGLQVPALLYFAIAIQMSPIHGEFLFKILVFPNFQSAFAAKTLVSKFLVPQICGIDV